MADEDEDEELTYEDLALSLEHSKAEALELRSIIRRWSEARGVDPIDGSSCTHRVVLFTGDSTTCMVCGEVLHES